MKNEGDLPVFFCQANLDAQGERNTMKNTHPIVTEESQ